MQTSNHGPSINVTPLIDILLVLIIIFMVITPYDSVGLKTAVPELSPERLPADADPRQIVLAIDRAQKLTLNSQPIAIENLGPRLESLFTKRAARTLFVQGAPELEYAPVARLIDIARGAHIDRVALLTQQSK